MATLLLQAAGSYLGSFFGAVGSTIGAAAGAYGGYLLDQSLINSTRHIKGSRLSSAQPLNGEEGANLARVFGTVRLSGTVIWATRFEEATKTERQGGKGSGPKVTTYTYFANFAVAICQGEISHVRRIWVDGKELDQTEHAIRIYRGTDDQLQDPLIEAKQGAGNAPAYRGTAYAVFDRFALANYGNRIPQIQFEVIRAVGGINNDIEAITIIPGSTEFGLSPSAVTKTTRPGASSFLNKHVFHAGSDWEASIDELQALCPNLKRVALVVAWFGNDLRAGNCSIRPKNSTSSPYSNDRWNVAGLTRATAGSVTQYNGQAAYGGSPDDASVIAAINDLKARGLKVTLYPFVLMDIPTVNNLPSPYGGTSQPSYPWRGEISCAPAPGIAGSVDGTATAASQISSFIGSAPVGAFSISAGAVVYSGPQEWSYRRLILHYAKIAQLAGGVDAFLIGSEFKALTRVRGNAGFPFVNGLIQLASDVRSILGPAVKLTYAADWSEYSAYMPPGTNDLYFHLDPLWASPHINSIGIDNYMPLSDWRDEDWNAGNPDGATSPWDIEALQNGVATGEGYDWYYANFADRQARVRQPITDTMAGKPWVFRYKDLQGWWQNQHFDRINGVEKLTPTDWVPQSKPIWFTELGCAAIDKAANQPNVFQDPKSASAAIPYYSNARRDDEIQMRFLKAHYRHWSHPSNNPVSTLYAGRMLDLDHNYLWAWDARPFPHFPLNNRVWGDGENWLTGHWLNGRLSSIALQDLIASILHDHDVQHFDVSKVDGVISGFTLFDSATVREALDALLSLMRIDVCDKTGKLSFVSQHYAMHVATRIQGLALNEDQSSVSQNIDAVLLSPSELSLTFQDPMREYQTATVSSRDPKGTGSMETIALPLVLDTCEAASYVRQFHRQRNGGGSTITFVTGWADIGLEVGDLVELEPAGEKFRIERTTEQQVRKYEATRILQTMVMGARPALPALSVANTAIAGPPLCVFLDLPTMPARSQSQTGLRIAAWSKPWSPVAALASATQASFIQKTLITEPSIMGTLTTQLGAGQSGRIMSDHWFEVEIEAGGLASLPDETMLNGANAAAIMSQIGVWEIIQFGEAVEVSAGRWRLQRLLRGQQGTVDAMHAGASIGARFVLLDDGVKSCDLNEIDAGLTLNWKVGPANKAISNAFFDEQAVPAAKRAKTTNAPAHFKFDRKENGDVFLSWIRCGAVDADSWDASEIPLSENVEAYRITVRASDMSIKRQVTSSVSNWTYPNSFKLADFGAGEPSAIFEISQIGANGLAGLSRTLGLTF